MPTIVRVVQPIVSQIQLVDALTEPMTMELQPVLLAHLSAQLAKQQQIIV